MSKKVGLIDLGSNSIRLVIYLIRDGKYYEQQHNVKVNARISQYIDDQGDMTKEGIARILEALLQFREVLSFHQVQEVKGVATAAIRQSNNREDILKQIVDLTALEFDVLSGEEEAYYGSLAVIRSTPITDGVTIDIGGGSTEITVLKNSRMLHSHSFPFGAITLTKQFISGKQMTEQEIEELELFLEEQFNTLPWLKHFSFPVIGIGGAARNIALVHQKRRKYPLSGVHQYEIAANELQQLLGLFQSKSPAQLKKLDGLSKDRVDIILPAFIVIYQLIKKVAAPRFVMSSKGLRDGLVYHHFLEEQ